MNRSKFMPISIQVQVASIKRNSLISHFGWLLLNQIRENRCLVASSCLRDRIERCKGLSGVIFKSDFSGESRSRAEQTLDAGFAKGIIPCYFHCACTTNRLEFVVVLFLIPDGNCRAFLNFRLMVFEEFNSPRIVRIRR